MALLYSLLPLLALRGVATTIPPAQALLIAARTEAIGHASPTMLPIRAAWASTTAAQSIRSTTTLSPTASPSAV